MVVALTPEQRRQLEELRAQRAGGVPSFEAPLDTAAQIAEPVIPAPTAAPVIPAPAPIAPEPVQAPIAAPVIPAPVAAPAPAPIAEPAPAPSLMDQFGESVGRQQSANLAQVDIGEEAVAEQAEIRAQQSEIGRQAEETRQRVADQVVKDRQFAQDAYDNKVQEFESEKYEGFWQSKSTGEKILGGLAVALGAFAQGLSGGRVPNTALTIINKAMDDDFQQFRQKKLNMLEVLKKQKVSIEDQRRFAVDFQNELEARKQAQLSQLQIKLEDLGSRTKSAAARENVNKLNEDLEQRKLHLQLQQKERLDNEVIARLQQAREVDTAKFGEEGALRKEYNALPEVKEQNAIERSYNKITAADSTAAGDLSMLFGYMKILDPTSVVRESEFAAAAKSGGLDDRVQGFALQVLNGQRLTSDQRADFLKQAENLRNANRKKIESIDSKFSEIAERRGLDTRNILGGGSPESAAETKTVNGVTYQKVTGGWRKVKK